MSINDLTNTLGVYALKVAVLTRENENHVKRMEEGRDELNRLRELDVRHGQRVEKLEKEVKSLTGQLQQATLALNQQSNIL